MNELHQSDETDVRVLEHRSVILNSLWKASDLKTAYYIQTIALLDLRDLLIMTIGVLGAAMQLPGEAFPFVMGPAPGQSNDGAGFVPTPTPSAHAAPILGPPPGQPAFGPPFAQPAQYQPPTSFPPPPPPFQNAPPVVTEDLLRQLAQFYTPEQMANYLSQIPLQQAAPPAPPPSATDTPKRTRAPKGTRRHRNEHAKR